MSVSGEGYETARASLELLYEVGREIAAKLDLRTVLQRVLFLSMKYTGANSGSIIVLDDNGQPGESAFLMVGQTHDQTALQLRVTYENGMAGWVARHREAALISDTSKDQRWLRRPDDAESRTGSKSAVSAPIFSQDQLVGVITLVHPQPGLFTQEHLELVKAIGDQAGTAIRNAQLYESLQAAHRRYRELFQDSIDSIIISDWEGKILEINRQAELSIGSGHERSLTLNICDVHDVDFSVVGLDFKTLAAGAMLSYESILNACDGRRIPVQVYVRQIQDGSETQLQWLLRDITERKDLDHLRDDLIAMVYHDLRSPLANIVSSLDVLLTMFSDGDEIVRSLLAIARRSTERIQRLTNSLLDINSLEAGQQIGVRLPVAPQTLIQDAVDAVLPNAHNRDLELTWEASADLPEISADLDMIRRVIINLLENAIKFTPEKGKIRVSAQAKSEWVEFSVSDTGLGIPAGDRERIFEKFTRLSPLGGQRGLGLGLGLAYCRLAVQAHQGQIWVESQPGGGAIFKFTIPLASGPEFTSDR